MNDTVFIASSAKGLKVAEKLQTFLGRHYKCQLWTPSFRSGESILESLLRLTKECKAGLFLGALGRPNVAICVQRSPKVRLPTDLKGQNHIVLPVDDTMDDQTVQEIN